MTNFKEFSDNRMTELIDTWYITGAKIGHESESANKIFIDTLIHTKYNYPELHNQLLNNLNISIQGEWEWRCNRVIPTLDVKKSVMNFIAGNFLGN
jgi:hypothetical protein